MRGKDAFVNKPDTGTQRLSRFSTNTFIDTSKLLKRESEDLSKESRLLRSNGHRLQSVLDARKILVEETLVETTTQIEAGHR